MSSLSVIYEERNEWGALPEAPAGRAAQLGRRLFPRSPDPPGQAPTAAACAPGPRPPAPRGLPPPSRGRRHRYHRRAPRPVRRPPSLPPSSPPACEGGRAARRPCIRRSPRPRPPLSPAVAEAMFPVFPCTVLRPPSPCWAWTAEGGGRPLELLPPTSGSRPEAPAGRG